MQATHTLSNAAHTNVTNALAFAPTASLTCYTPIPQAHQAFQAKPLRHEGLTRLDLQGQDALDFSVALAASVFHASIPASYAACEIQERNGLADITTSTAGMLFAFDEGVAPAPTPEEEAMDLFLEGCVEMADLQTYIPRRGFGVQVRTFIKKVIRVGLFA